MIGNEDTFAHAVSTTSRGGSGSAGAHLWRDLIKHFRSKQAIIRHASYTVPRRQDAQAHESIDVEGDEVVDVASLV